MTDFVGLFGEIVVHIHSPRDTYCEEFWFVNMLVFFLLVLRKLEKTFLLFLENDQLFHGASDNVVK